MKIIDYEILFDTSVAGLEAEVKAWIAKGWQPKGGHTAATSIDWNRDFSQYESTVTYSQSMVLFEDTGVKHE
jgi:hypothetical protein